MTGHGAAERNQDGVVVAAELRTVNNRYLKVSLRTSDGFAQVEPRVETVIRRYLRRGSVQVNIRIDRQTSQDDYQLNEVVLASYRKQLESICSQAGFGDSIHLESLLMLPGVIDERGARPTDAEADWPLVEQVLVEALEHLAQMRADEGAAMREDLLANCKTIGDELAAIEQRAPQVVEAYQTRLTERLNRLLAEHEIRVEPADVVREVGIFSERSDIAEEIVRLRSHLEQFGKIADEQHSNGRKLEFVIQEMLRETNTIGSKANDAEISKHVVEIKTAIERMREMIQNVE